MKRICALLFSVLVAWSATAEVKLPEIVGNDMVLQQNTEVRLWGWVEPQHTVRVETSWGVSGTARSNGDGRWELRIKTPEGSYTPQRIRIDGQTLENVLIGEVWFAGGQSNMEMPLYGYDNCPVDGADGVIARAATKRNKIHYAHIDHAQAYTPQERAKGAWNAFSPETAPRCSATAYFYAELLNEVLDVPVGIIDCSWGGSRVESWCNREVLTAYSDIDLTEAGIQRGNEWERPLVMYNAMLHPTAPYTVRGFIWYQGEQNHAQYADYAQRLADMVALWRTEWGAGELPFYYTEIAPYDYTDNKSARMREAQWAAQRMIPGSALICTNDLVEPYEAVNIHPRNKRGVGYRLASLALNKTYGFSTIACDYPTFRTMEIADGKIRLTFDHAGHGYNRMADIKGFEVCGADRVFHPAQASIDTGTQQVIVYSDEVAQPIAARYCFRDFQIGNLASAFGLPVVPFRTDDFRE